MLQRIVCKLLTNVFVELAVITRVRSDDRGTPSLDFLDLFLGVVDGAKNRRRPGR
jgi:hypothetical protein